MTACAIFPVASVGAAGAVPPIRGGKCHLWCLAPGQRIYVRWRAVVRRARRLAVGPAAGIRYYPLEDKGVLVTTIPPAEMRDSVSHSRMSDLMALTISHLCLSALPRRERSAYHCSACASLSCQALPLPVQCMHCAGACGLFLCLEPGVSVRQGTVGCCKCTPGALKNAEFG